MTKIVFAETEETLKIFDTTQKALEWIEENCRFTLAWLMGSEEGKAYYKGEEIKLI